MKTIAAIEKKMKSMMSMKSNGSKVKVGRSTETNAILIFRHY
ncbi:hypothetical protein [Chamaesiphon minutus]|nr:hypothetical protein [Chamaesiphon minutus]